MKHRISKESQSTQSAEFEVKFRAHIAQQNARINHSDFVAGVKSGRLGVKFFYRDPSQFLRGLHLTIFKGLVILYSFFPLLAVSVVAYIAKDWWFLFGIFISYLGSYSSAKESKAIIWFTCFCAGLWLYAGFSIHQYVTVYYICALWGYTICKTADEFQYSKALLTLVENRRMFDSAILKDEILVVQKP
jgi:hypothetical protein